MVFSFASVGDKIGCSTKFYWQRKLSSYTAENSRLGQHFVLHRIECKHFYEHSNKEKKNIGFDAMKIAIYSIQVFNSKTESISLRLYSIHFFENAAQPFLNPIF